MQHRSRDLDTRNGVRLCFVGRRADVMAAPWRLPEPFDRIAVKAMTSGRLVIASRPELVDHGNAGLLVMPVDPGHRPHAITVRLDRSARLETLGRSGDLCREARFSLPESGKRLARGERGCVLAEMSNRRVAEWCLDQGP